MNRNKKRILIIFSALLLALSLSACADKDADTQEPAISIEPSKSPTETSKAQERESETPSPEQTPDVAQIEAISKSIDEMIAETTVEVDDAWRIILKTLDEAAKINPFLNVSYENYSFRDSVKDEAVGYVLGELLGDAFNLYGYVETANSILESSDIPEQMISLIQIESKMRQYELRGMVDAGITPDNYVDAIQCALKVYEYQDAIRLNFQIREMDTIVLDLGVLCKRLEFNHETYRNGTAYIELLSKVRDAVNSGDIDVAAFAENGNGSSDECIKEFESLLAIINERYAPLRSYLYDVEPGINGVLGKLYYDPYRVMELENNVGRRKNVIDTATSFLPVGGTIASSAINSLDAKGRDNIYRSITLPNLFAQEYVFPEIYLVNSDIKSFRHMLELYDELLDKAKTDNDISCLAIIKYLTDNDAKGILDNDFKEIENGLIKLYYTYNLSTELYYASLFTSDADYFTNNQITNTEVIRTQLLDPMGSDWDQSDISDELDNIRKTAIDVYKQIIDYSMDNNELEAHVSGGTKIDYITPLGKNGNKLYYDKKTLFNGMSITAKAVETQSPDSDKPRFIVYYSVLQTPCYIEDTQTGEFVYICYTTMTPSGDGFFKRGDFKYVSLSENGKNLENEYKIWSWAYDNIGVTEDSSLTAEIDGMR